MKRNEVAKLMDKIPQGLSPDEFLVALATHAAAWEREACAKVCDELDKHPDHLHPADCAEAIRARSEK